MPSDSLQRWRTQRRKALDQMGRAHKSMEGTGPGLRHAREQVSQAYTMLLVSQFQAFCRDLHDECVDHLVKAITPVALQDAVRAMLLENRKLDKGNPNPGNIGSDFGRFGVAFWTRVRNIDARNQARQDHLETLNRWRNAIAHQDFVAAGLGGVTPRLGQVKQWRAACEQLATSFAAVMRWHIEAVTGTAPW